MPSTEHGEKKRNFLQLTGTFIHFYHQAGIRVCGFTSIICVSREPGLAEEVADFLVDMAQEVDVGRTAGCTAVLHQVLLEYRLQLVSLADDVQLQEIKHDIQNSTIT